MTSSTDEVSLKSDESELKHPGTKEEAVDIKKPVEDQAKCDAPDIDEEGNDKVPFPLTLHEIVSDPATDHCIHWLPDGNLFTIADKKKFAKEVLPKLNGHAKYTSFTRRLKRWGFSRIASGPQIGSYQNPDFVKEDPERAKNIKYMNPKPMSVTAIQKHNANQVAKLNFAAGVGAFGAQALPQALSMLPMGLHVPAQAANPMEAYLRLVTGGNDVNANNIAAAAPVNNQNNMVVQLAMLHEMQNRHTMQQMQNAPVAAAPHDEAKPDESFGEKIIRTNPSLAAQLIEANSMNMMSPRGVAVNNANANPMMAMLAAQNSQLYQQQMNPALLQQLQMGNQGGYQQNLNAMMFALLQQEQQQQQMQQHNEFIKNLMSKQSQAPAQVQAQAPANNQSASTSDNSLLVTPSSSAPNLL